MRASSSRCKMVDVWLDVAEQTFELENKPYELSAEELAQINVTPLVNAETVATTEVTAEEVAPAISVCTGAAESSTDSLSNGQSLDLNNTTAKPHRAATSGPGVRVCPE